jgi:hypothetical protein
MSVVMTRRRTRRAPRQPRQPSLFSQMVQPPPRVPEERPQAAVADWPEPTAMPAPAELDRPAEVELDRAAAALVDGPTLDAAISAVWDDILAGEPGACPLCGDAMQPRHSAGAGVVGGRCGSCATTLA